MLNITNNDFKGPAQTIVVFVGISSSHLEGIM